MKNYFWKVWAMPIIVGISSTVGLLSALTGDGIYDVTSWLTLGFVVVVTTWFLIRARRSTGKSYVKSR